LNYFHLGGQSFHHDYIRWGWLTLVISFQPTGMWSFDNLDCYNSVVSHNYLKEICVVAFGGGWNCKHKHAVDGRVDRHSRDSIQICINLNPGINKFLDRDDEVNYFTSENAIECIERENSALFALQASLLCVGFSHSSSSCSSSTTTTITKTNT